MSDKKGSNPKIARRGFLKGALAAGAAATVVSTGAVQALAAEAEPCKKPSWLTPPAPIADSQITKTVEVDVVVVGAGVAGLATALAAAEKGAKVALVEKTKTYAARGMHNACINSKLHKAAGIELPKEKIISELICWASNRVNQKLIRTWANNSGAMMDFYIDFMRERGFDAFLVPETFQVSPQYHEYQTAVQFFDPKNKGEIFTEHLLTAAIEAEIKKLGGEIFYSTPAQQLVRDKSGRVIGVIAKSKAGYVKFLGKKGVVLASGDYGSNKEKMEAWCPIALKCDVNTYTPAGANQGDGIDMAMWVGGTIQDTPHPSVMHIIPFIQCDFMSSNQSVLHINRDGERFMNEAQPLQGIVDGKFMQPENKVWAIFDSNYFKDFSRWNNVLFGPTVEPIEKLEESVQKGFAWKGETIEELAAKLKVPAAALKASAARYTEMAKKGADEDFGKQAELMFPIEKAPFYALYVPAHLLVIVGGLNVNDKHQVLDKNTKAIEGLYAVGNAAGNLFANDYPLTCPGMTHGRGLTFGRMLGQTLAQKA